MKPSSVTSKNLIKFIICSFIGIGVFLIPIPKDGSFTTGITELTSLVKSVFSPFLNTLLLVVLFISTVLSLIARFAKPAAFEKPLWKSAVSTSWLSIITKVFALVVMIMVYFGFGPEFLISADTGANMVSLAANLLTIVFTLSFFMPFLTDCGIMEFLGVITRPVVHPLFKVPGRASVDLIASWFGASNAAVILTREQYNKGYYNGREASFIMTNFSLVSIPFCLLIAETVGVTNYFPLFYLIICVVGIVLAVILCRIPPICRISEEYSTESGKQLREDVPADTSKMKWALEISCDKAAVFGPKDVATGVVKVITNMYFDLIPIVITWGTVALVLVTFTPVFNWISYPMGLYMNLLGVQDAFLVAPATLVGFIDMFIPALLCTEAVALKTRFIIGILSLVQIIYLTEVGAVIIKSKVPMNLGHLIIVFLERTIIALPLIVLLTNLLVPGL